MNEGNFEMIKKLLKSPKTNSKEKEESMLENKQKIDPNIPDANGNTPLIKVIQRIVEKRKNKASFKLELKVAKLLLELEADPGMKNKAGESSLTMIMQTGSYSNTLARSEGISELIQLLWAGFSFISNPESFFSFNNSILSPDTQSMILSFIEKSMKELKGHPKEDEDVEMSDGEEKIQTTPEGKLPSEIINTLDEEGFSPFLRYVCEFTKQGRKILERIEKEIASQNIHIEADLHKVDMSAMMTDKVQNNRNGFGLFGAVNPVPDQNQKKLALHLFDESITKSFTEFLKEFIKFGADQHATVDKLKDYRDRIDQNGLQFKKRDSYGKIRNEYCSSGLSNALHLILEFPSQTVFDFLLESDVSTEEINIKKMTPFFKLIKTKDTSMIEYKHWLDKFINTKSDIDSPDQFGISAFWYCYQNQKVDLALYLAAKGADVNRLDNYGFFALKSEVFNNNLDRIKRLLDVGADINKADEFHRTVLHHAFNRYRIGNDLGIIKYLINKGADINAKDFKNRTPLHYLFVKSNRRFRSEPNDCSDVLIQIINFQAMKNNNLQNNRIVNNPSDGVVDPHANVNNQDQGLPTEIWLNEKDKNGQTVLHYICQTQALECLKMLKPHLQEKDFEVVNKDGNSALAVALFFGHVNIATYILNNFNVDLNGWVFKLHKDQSQLGNNVQGEESDFEFMFTEEVKEDKQKEAEKLKGCKTFFEF